MAKPKFPAAAVPVSLALLGLLLGSWGGGWGLPARWRVQRVLPPGADTPALRVRLEKSWSTLHERLGPDLMLNPAAGGALSGPVRVKAGWTEPPEVLLSSLRSFFIRSAHEDEQSALLVLSRMRPWRFELHPHLFTYGGTYLYALGAWEAAGAALGIVRLRRSLGPYLEEPDAMASLYRWGRAFSAAAYAGCALLLYLIGRRHLGAGAGAFAGLLFLLSPAAVTQAHVLKNHCFWAFWALVGAERSLTLLDDGRPRRWAEAGAASGLAVGAFLMAWPACVFVALACAFRLRAPRAKFAVEAKHLALAALCAIAAFFITNPYWLLRPSEVRAEMAVLGGFSAFSFDRPLRFLWGPMRLSLTPPLFALVVGGAVWAGARGRREPKLALAGLLFLAGLAATFMVANVDATRQARYGLGWSALGVLLAARLAADLLRAASPAGRPWLAALAGLLALRVGISGATYAQNFRLDGTERSTHAQSGAWIDANVPAGATMGLLRPPQPSNAPYFRLDRLALLVADADTFSAMSAKELPGWLAVTSPDYDDRPALASALAKYELAAAFPRCRLLPWIEIDPTATTANPLIEIYRRRS